MTAQNSSFTDPVHAAVLAPGETAAVQVVRGAARAAEEEGVCIVYKYASYSF